MFRSHCLFCFLTLTLMTSSLLGAPSSSASGFSNTMNPSISFNMLFLGSAAPDAAQSRPAVSEEGLLTSETGTPYGADLQEAELQVASVVDPFWELSAHIVLHGGEFHMEEAYAYNKGLPSTTLKLGKMKASFGKHGLLHTHAFPFVQAPLVAAGTLGEEGYIDTGIEAAWLSPLPFYSEFTFGVFSGTAGHVHGEEEAHGGPLAYASPRKDDFAYLGHWKSFFETGKDATLELGFSGLTGRNAHGIMEGSAGLDLTFKSVPPVKTAKAWILQGEWISRIARHDGENHKGLEGHYLLLQNRFARNWWAGLGWDRVIRTTTEVIHIEPLDSDEDEVQDADAEGNFLWEEHHHPAHPADSAKRVTANLTWAPSEFSAIRFEYSFGATTLGERDLLDRRVYLQFNQTIGAHPAHNY
jgi:hypothetical protein